MAERGPILGTLLVDLENLYLSFKDAYQNPTDLTVTTLQALRRHLADLGITTVLGRAYAPFDYSSARVIMNDLALMGITPVHVLAYASKNSADLMLAIDAMETLFRRTDIEVFVIVGGDRDYIPVVERIRQNAKRVLVVSPRHAMSGDLLTIIGPDGYIDPLPLLPEGRLRPAVRPPEPPPRPEPEPEPVQLALVPAEPPAPAPVETPPEPEAEAEPAPVPAPAPPVSVPPPPPPMPADMGEVARLVDDAYELEDLKTLMRMVLEFQASRRIQEIWLGPFFRVMNDAFPLKSNADRKELLNRLEAIGAVEIADRPRSDDGGTYAVLLVNWSHPLVIEANPG